MTLKVALHTLGCKVNQYETQKIADDFARRGFEIVDFSEPADVYIINSCTVTQTADSKSRQAARAASHRNPEAMVVLTGCYAETSSQEAAGVEGVSLVIGNRDKSRVAEIVSSYFPSALDATLHSPADKAKFPPSPCPPVAPSSDRRKGTPQAASRTRALLKIQDGCDQFCAYCAVPLARSTMSSTPLADVIAESERLAQRGYKEVVLTGIRLGRYDDEGKTLTDLLRAVAQVEGIERIRLSSIELTDIPQGMIDLMAENPKICRHLHLPLQSGDDETLRRMNRPYTPSQFAEFVDGLRARIPDVAVTTDIMVGFPGETAEQFETALGFVERVHFSRAHVFRYSPRPHTAAASFSDGVHPSEKDRRSQLLIQLTDKHEEEFAESLVGRTVQVLVEGKKLRTGQRSGLTDTYVRVIFDAGPEVVGQLVDVYVTGAEKGIAQGRIVSE